jgi:hypothetical protein
MVLFSYWQDCQNGIAAGCYIYCVGAFAFNILFGAIRMTGIIVLPVS